MKFLVLHHSFSPSLSLSPFLGLSFLFFFYIYIYINLFLIFNTADPLHYLFARDTSPRIPFHLIFDEILWSVDKKSQTFHMFERLNSLMRIKFSRSEQKEMSRQLISFSLLRKKKHLKFFDDSLESHAVSLFQNIRRTAHFSLSILHHVLRHSVRVRRFIDFVIVSLY